MIKKIFKIKNLILMGLVVFILSACEKDKDSDTNANNIIGIWTITSSTFDATINGESIVQYLMEALGLDQTQAEAMASLFISPFTGTIDIKSDGTYTSVIEGETESGTWELSSDNKKLTLDAGTPDESVMDVVVLTSSNLEVSYSETSMEDMDEDGTPETMIIEIDLKLTK